MFVLLQTYVSSSLSSLCRWYLRRSWYPYWWWLIVWSPGMSPYLLPFKHWTDGSQLLMSCMMYSRQLERVENVYGEVHCCSCNMHRTMAAAPEDIRHEASSLHRVLILWTVVQAVHMMTGVDGICGSGPSRTVKNGGVENAGLDLDISARYGKGGQCRRKKRAEVSRKCNSIKALC